MNYHTNFKLDLKNRLYLPIHFTEKNDFSLVQVSLTTRKNVGSMKISQKQYIQIRILQKQTDFDQHSSFRRCTLRTSDRPFSDRISDFWPKNRKDEFFRTLKNIQNIHFKFQFSLVYLQFPRNQLLKFYQSLMFGLSKSGSQTLRTSPGSSTDFQEIVNIPMKTTI